MNILVLLALSRTEEDTATAGPATSKRLSLVRLTAKAIFPRSKLAYLLVSILKAFS